MNKLLTWLGLVDEGEPAREMARDQRLPAGGRHRPAQHAQARPVGVESRSEPPPGPRFAEAAPTYRRPAGYTPDLSVVVRPGDQAGSIVGYTETVPVRSFDDAKRIADLLRERIPVIANLRDADPSQVRRLVDFSCGLVYGLDGTMRKVSEGVLLMSPPRVKIRESELRRLSELGLYDLGM